MVAAAAAIEHLYIEVYSGIETQASNKFAVLVFFSVLFSLFFFLLISSSFEYTLYIFHSLSLALFACMLIMFDITATSAVSFFKYTVLHARFNSFFVYRLPGSIERNY